MTATETTRTTSLRNALRVIRADYADESYVSGPRYYECDRGTLMVRHEMTDGGCLLGLFVVELIGADGRAIKSYKV